MVLTHLHYDHTGNLGRFPNAELLVPARELEFWFGPLARRAQFAHAVEASELGHAAALGYGEQISNRVVDALGDIAGGVRIHDQTREAA
jgi:glyoxylase-like metal-dependent hydrolase (beta-lactamase superfamily II)